MATKEKQKKEEAPESKIPAEDEDAVLDKKTVSSKNANDGKKKTDYGNQGSEFLDEKNNEDVDDATNKS